LDAVAKFNSRVQVRDTERHCWFFPAEMASSFSSATGWNRTGSPASWVSPRPHRSLHGHQACSIACFHTTKLRWHWPKSIPGS